jgi:hypothetical protein
MRILVSAVVAACSVALVASPQDEKKSRDNARVMVVKGCVNRTRLDVSRVDNTGLPGFTDDHFHLRGNKDLMKVFTKDLNGHMVEVTGVVDDPHNTQGHGKTIKIGTKTTITTQSRDTPSVPDPMTDATLTVESFKDIDSRCTTVK